MRSDSGTQQQGDVTDDLQQVQLSSWQECAYFKVHVQKQCRSSWRYHVQLACAACMCSLHVQLACAAMHVCVLRFSRACVCITFFSKCVCDTCVIGTHRRLRNLMLLIRDNLRRRGSCVRAGVPR